MLFFAISEISSRHQFYKKNENIYNFLTLVDLLDKLVFELQKERGISLGLSETKSTFFNEKISTQRELTDKAFQSYFKSINNFDSDFMNIAKRKELLKLNKLLEQLPIIREKIDSANFDRALDEYSALNTRTINLIRHLQQLADDNGMVRLGDAYTNLLWLRERAGQERAALIWVFATGHINADYFHKLVSFVESQQTLIENYDYKAPQKYRHLLKQKLSHQVNEDVENFRKAALNKVVRNENINELLSLIGYGGFIHHFKNYVIRGNKTYLERVHHLEREIRNIFKKFKNIPV